jgi:hypothetical protein
MSITGATRARSSSMGMTNDGEDDRDDQVPVVRGRPLDVRVDRGGAAHYGVGARDRVHGRARSMVSYAA